MRNGNTSNSKQFPFSSRSSYPTYEEWKRFLNKKLPSDANKSSYPTYEEWKRIRNGSTLYKSAYFVLILPMRNGNNIPVFLPLFTA